MVNTEGLPRGHIPLRLMPELPTKTQPEKGWNGNVRRNKVLVVERMLQAREPIDQQNEDTQAERQTVHPDTARSSERICRDIDLLMIETRSYPQVREDYACPGDICCCSADSDEVPKQLSGCDLEIHKRQESPETGCQD